MTIESPCGRAALDLVERGIAVIPVKPESKTPATLAGLNDWSDNPEQIKYWWGIDGAFKRGRSDPQRNVAVVCGMVSGGLICIDLDVHGDADGLQTLKEWEKLNGELPETWTQITGSGGKQMFYRATRTVRPSTNGAIGVDIRGDGSYAIVPPSIHPNGETYEWSVSPDDCELAQANDRVYEFIEYVRPNSSNNSNGSGDRFDLPETIDHDRNNTLFKYASSLRAKGNSAVEIGLLLQAANVSRCKPPLDDNELQKIIGSACKYEQGHKPTSTAPISDENGESTEGEGQMLRSIFSRPKKPAKPIKDKTVTSVLNVLMSLKEVRECIKLNRFDSRLHVLGACIPDVAFESPHVLTERETAYLRIVLERDYGIRSKSCFEDAIQGFSALASQGYNPMRTLLATLPEVRWLNPDSAGNSCLPIEISHDGGKTWERTESVIGTLTYELLDVEPTTYSNEVEKLMFRQLVARALHPGCKADQMFVFVGKQGTGKSTFVRLLGLSNEFFLEGFSNFDTEDLKRISGKLVVEIPELDGFNGRDKNKIKSIITQTTDNYRESYAKVPVEHPRTAVFFGTTNDGAFLNDNTGGRRYMLVESPKPMLSADKRLFNGVGEGLIKQAWAETLALYKLWGKDRFLQSLKLPQEAAEEAQQATEKFSEEDSNVTNTLSFIEECETKGIERVNIKMILLDGFGFNEWQAAQTQKYVKQTITQTLDSLDGWERVGKQKIGRYGTARTWATGQALEAFKNGKYYLG